MTKSYKPAVYTVAASKLLVCGGLRETRSCLFKIVRIELQICADPEIIPISTSAEVNLNLPVGGAKQVLGIFLNY